MATKPTPGASVGTWGTEMNTFLDVSLDVNGFIKTEALQTDSTAPSADAAVANKKYVDDGGERLVDGVATVVHTKYFTGTTDADSQTAVVHGVASALTKILHVSGGITTSTGLTFLMSDYDSASVANRGFTLRFDATNILFADVESLQQSKSYIIKVDFID